MMMKLASLDRCCGPSGILRRAREVILTRKQIKRTRVGVDPLDLAAQVAIDPLSGADWHPQGRGISGRLPYDPNIRPSQDGL